MKRDHKVLLPAKVEARKVKFTKSADLRIDFANQIDAWAMMEFKSRKQVTQLRQYGTLNGHEILKDLNSLVYAIREDLD